MIIRAHLRLFSFMLLLCVLLPGSQVAAQSESSDGVVDSSEPIPRVLIFSKTTGFRHASIPVGVQCMKELAAELGFEVVATEDAAVFSKQGLEDVAVVVFMNTTGDVLDAEQEKAFESWFRSGGGWLGVHSAADTEYDWPFYGELVGAYFKSHPAIQSAVVVVEDADHPSTRMLPGLWRRSDEWYTYRLNPRPNVRVLASVDETTFTGGGMDGDHPIAWCHEMDSGRSLYTGGGHTDETFSEPAFRAHLLGALRWLSRQSDEPEPLGADPGRDSEGEDAESPSEPEASKAE